MTARILLSALLGLGLMGCKGDPPCALDDAITGGCGVQLADGELRVGGSLEAMVVTIGEPSWVDLGSAGQRFDYSDLGVTGFSRDGLVIDSLRVSAPFEGTTADGIGLGMSILEVPQTMGAGQGSPWVELNWQLTAGLGFEYEADTITRIHIVPTQEPW